MKQTAVDFLSEKYMYVTWLRNRDEISIEQADKLRAQYLAEAKEIEKEQIIDAATWGANAPSGEKYYNETYGDDT
jgi:hypothetical protein